MPSIMLGTPVSGGQPLFSGSQWSGIAPRGGVLLTYDPTDYSGGVCYINLSGNGTLRSGGLKDGMPLTQGQSYFVQRMCFPGSGTISGNIYVYPDANASGKLLFYEVL